MTGRQALKCGLIDELGGFSRAVDVAKEMANLEVKPEVVEVGQAKKPMWERIGRRFIGQAILNEGLLKCEWYSFVLNAEIIDPYTEYFKYHI